MSRGTAGTNRTSKDLNLIMQLLINIVNHLQGFYGEVFKGMLEYLNAEQEPRKVAVKKLKSSAQTSTIQDFEREINIMKVVVMLKFMNSLLYI